MHPENANAADRKARFRELAATHTPGLYRYAWWLTRNHALSDDLVQDTFLRAWQSFDSLRDPLAVRKWLTTILRNEFLREIRRNRNNISIDATVDGVEDPAMEHNPSDVDRLELQDFLEKLPTAYRQPLVLQAVMGYSTREIAGILALSQAAVLSRLFRARRMLRELISATDQPASQAVLRHVKHQDSQATVGEISICWY